MYQRICFILSSKNKFLETNKNTKNQNSVAQSKIQTSFCNASQQTNKQTRLYIQFNRFWFFQTKTGNNTGHIRSKKVAATSPGDHFSSLRIRTAANMSSYPWLLFLKRRRKFDQHPRRRLLFKVTVTLLFWSSLQFASLRCLTRRECFSLMVAYCSPLSLTDRGEGSHVVAYCISISSLNISSCTALIALGIACDSLCLHKSCLGRR